MRARPKVLYVIPALVQGGAERQILELMRRVGERGFDTTLCVFTREGLHYRDLLPPGEPRYELGAHTAGARTVARLIRVLRAERPDLVHSFMDRANACARLAALAAGRPKVVTSVRGPMMQVRFLLFERLLSGLGARVVTNSAGIRAELIGRARVPPARVQVIHNLLDLERFGPPDETERARARRDLGLPAAAPVAAFVGMIGFAKYHVGYAHALWRLARSGRLPGDFVTLCAGRPRDRLPGWALPRWARLLGVGDRLRMLGAVHDVRAVWAAADFAVLPSLYEGLSNALIEAMACGLPVVVSRGANTDGLVEDGASGFVFPTGSTAALAGALARMLALPPAARRALGARGRADVRERLPVERPLQETLSLYRELLGLA